uniref:Uncharacterized protein n=1 Tax=Odontella aurita TaxID=265563 RepID=A0A7S4K820_9STRA
MAAASASSPSGGGSRRRSAVDRRRRRHDRGDDVAPDKYTAGTLLNLYSQSGMSGLGERALRLLFGSSPSSSEDEDEDAKGISSSVTVHPGVFDNHTLNALLHTVARDEDGGARGAQDLMFRAEEGGLDSNFSSGGESSSSSFFSGPLPDAVSYTVVASAWGRTGTLEGARNAESLLDRFQDRYIDMDPNERRRRNLFPDVGLYNCIIGAYASTRTREGAERAEMILTRMEKTRDDGGDGDGGTFAGGAVEPDEISYRSAINAWALCPEEDNRDGDDDATEEEDLPSARALSLLHRTLDLRRTSKKGLAGIGPSASAFTNVFRSFCRSRAPGSAERAEEVLFAKDAHRSVDPLVAFAATAADYAAVLRKWGRSRRNEDAERSLELLERMIQRNDEDPDGNPAPDAGCYNRVMRNFAEVGRDGGITSAQRAEDVLNLMESRYREGKGGGSDAVAPDRASYTCCLSAWARSKHPGALAGIRDFLRRNYAGAGGGVTLPDREAVDAVLKMCANAPRGGTATVREGKKDQGGGKGVEPCDPLGVAVETFGMFYGEGGGLGTGEVVAMRPSQASFAHMILSCANHMRKDDPRRTALATSLLRRCVEDGLLSPFVLEVLPRALPRGACRRELGMRPDENVEEWMIRDGMPTEWRRNVKGRHFGEQRFKKRELEESDLVGPDS